MSLTSRRVNVLYLVAASAAIVCLLIITSWKGHNGSYRDYQLGNFNGGKLRRRNRVAVASEFRQHFDVYLAATHTFLQVLGQDGHVQVFAHQPFLHGFQEVVESLHIYDQDIRHPDDLVGYMRSDLNYPDHPGKMTELLVFGTCEVEYVLIISMKFHLSHLSAMISMNRWSDELLDVWDARPADQKFTIVCIVHQFRDTNWQRHIAAWARRRSIRLLPIGYQSVIPLFLWLHISQSPMIR